VKKLTAGAFLLRDYEVDAVLISRLSKIRWLTDFTGSRAMLIIQEQGCHLVTDARYTEQAQAEVQHAAVVISTEAFYQDSDIRGLLDGAKRALFEGDHRTVMEQEAWVEAFPKIDWVPGRHLFQQQIACKTETELAHMRRAQEITETAFRAVLEILRPGMTEKEVAAELIYTHLRGNAECMSFEPIVASGPRSALPHARPTDRILALNEIILIDMGCVYRGYASDMTRIVALGDPGDRVKEIYGVVLEAQSRALEAARAGMSAQMLDREARGVIEAAGYGDLFTHGLGHGIGMDVHEWPRVSAKSQDYMPDGTVVTIEPGIYLRDQFGIRIEDTIAIKEGGSQRLGTLGRELITL